MTRFKRELIKCGIAVEETLPYLPFDHTEAINVHADRALVSTYDNRVGWIYDYYGRDMKLQRTEWEDDY